MWILQGRKPRSYLLVFALPNFKSLGKRREKSQILTVEPMEWHLVVTPTIAPAKSVIVFFKLRHLEFRNIEFETLHSKALKFSLERWPVINFKCHFSKRKKAEYFANSGVLAFERCFSYWTWFNHATPTHKRIVRGNSQGLTTPHHSLKNMHKRELLARNSWRVSSFITDLYSTKNVSTISQLFLCFSIFWTFLTHVPN